MADLFSNFVTFHSLFIPSNRFLPKLLQRHRTCSPFPSPKRRLMHPVLCDSSSHSTSSSFDFDSVSSNFGIVSETEYSDGSVVFRFGDVDEMLKNEELNKKRLGVIRSYPSEDFEGLNETKVLDENLESKKTKEKFGHAIRVESSDLSVEATQVVDLVSEKHEMPVKKNDGGNFDSKSESVVNDEALSNYDYVEVYSSEIGEHEEVLGVDAVMKDDDKTNTKEGSAINIQDEATVGTTSRELDAVSEKVVGVIEEADEDDDVDAETENMTYGRKGGDHESMSSSTSVEARPVVDEYTGNRTIDGLLEKDITGNSNMLDEQASLPNLEGKGSNRDQPLSSTKAELHSHVGSTYMEKPLTPEYILSSGAASLPHPSKALTGREDAYFIAGQNWFGVADGVGQWPLHGIYHAHYPQELMKNCRRIAADYNNDSVMKLEEVIYRSVAETLCPGCSTVLIAHFDGQALHVVNVGDTGFFVIRNSTIFQKSDPMVHEFCFPLQIDSGDDPLEIIQRYKIELEDGDTIVTATDGLFDNLYEQEIAFTVTSSVQAGLKPQEIAEMLAMRAQEVGRSTSTRSPFADSAQAAGYKGYSGGKLDDVTVIVSLAQKKTT